MKENRDIVMRMIKWPVRDIGQHSSDGMAREDLSAHLHDEQECVL